MTVRFLLTQLVSSRLEEKWLRICFATQLTRYIFIYCTILSFLWEQNIHHQWINMEYFELHGTGTVACKWQSILPNLCIILTWFQLSWYFDLFLFFIIWMFCFFFWEESPKAVWQCNLDRKNIIFYVRLLLLL